MTTCCYSFCCTKFTPQWSTLKCNSVEKVFSMIHNCGYFERNFIIIVTEVSILIVTANVTYRCKDVSVR